MLDPKKTEYSRIRAIARLPDAGYLWDWDDNVSPTRGIREIYRRAEEGDAEATKDRDWIAEQIKAGSEWHTRKKIMQVYRDWLAGRAYDDKRAHVYCPHCGGWGGQSKFDPYWHQYCEEAGE